MDGKFPCTQQYPNLMDAIVNCIGIHPELGDYEWLIDKSKITKVIFYLKDNRIVNFWANQTLEPKFHHEFGLCYTLDNKYWPRSVEKIKIQIVDNSWTCLWACNYKIILHDKSDLADAQNIHQSFTADTSSPHEDQIVIRQKSYTKKSSNSMPCSDHWPITCRQSYLRKMTENEHNCRIPLLNMQNKTLPQCSAEITQNVMNSTDLKLEQCEQVFPCKYTKFEASLGLSSPVSKSVHFFVFCY